MTSEERREARYRRRQRKRQEKREARGRAVGTMEEVFSYRNLFQYGRKCCNGVRWKYSTQKFELHLFSVTARTRRKLLDRTWRPGRTVHFTLRERGKVREIDAPHIEDRQVYKTYTKLVLAPLYGPGMIWANGASQKGKGLHWHYRRLKEDLRRHYRKNGRAGAVFLMDFHQFFPSAPRALIYERHRRLIPDRDLRELGDRIVGASPGEAGMPLGVEPSQQEMVSLPSALDHHIQSQMGIRGAGHYMDDYYAILPGREEAREAGAEIIGRAERMGLTVNRRKCQVTELSKPFRWCKVKFCLTETGRVMTHGCRDGMKRARRKLKLMKRREEAGQITKEEAEQWLNSQTAYYRHHNDHGRVLRLRRLYHELFGGDRRCIELS